MGSFVFPPLLEHIGNFAFTNCLNLIFCDLRDTNLKFVGQNAFGRLGKTIYLPLNAPISLVSNCFSNKLIICNTNSEFKQDECGYIVANKTIVSGNKKQRHVLIRRCYECISKCCFHESKLVSVTIPSSITEICERAFLLCRQLKTTKFAENSQLKVIKSEAFCNCSSIQKINFPKSLEIIEEKAFSACGSLEYVFFSQDSRLRRIEAAFGNTNIKRLELPSSVKEIVSVTFTMNSLKSIRVCNDIYQNNIEENAIFSKDGSELYYVLRKMEKFEIPEGVRVIKKRAFYGSMIYNCLVIPSSVEVIEKEAFYQCFYLKKIIFNDGSRLKSLAHNAFGFLKELIINNESFVTKENGVIMSQNPRGIVYVPRKLAEINVEPDIEVIYSNSFYKSKINRIKLPKSLKKISSDAFLSSRLESIEFEEGTELDSIGSNAFIFSRDKEIKLPFVKGKFDLRAFGGINVLVFPPNLSPASFKESLENPISCIKKIICPISLINALAQIDFSKDVSVDFIDL